MASTVSIANRCLAHLGTKRIQNLSDNTDIDLAFEEIRDQVLDAHPWNFAMGRAQLAANATAPDWGFSTAYDLPADCLRVTYIDGQADYTWEVEGRQILTDIGAPLNIRYIRRITDPNQMSPLFRAVFAAQMAFDLWERIAPDNPKRNAFGTYLVETLWPQARSRDGQEGGALEYQVDAWTGEHI